MISQYGPPLPFLLPDLEPPHSTNVFPSVSPFCCSRKRPERRPPDDPPPSHLAAGEPDLPGVPHHLHYIRHSTLGPFLPSVAVAVAGIAAGELAVAVAERLKMTGGPRLSSSPLPLSPRCR